MNNGNVPKNNRDRALSLLCIVAIIFTVVFILVNRKTLSLWGASIVSVLNPVIIGFIIAYLCNPIYNWLRNKALSKISQAKLKKALAIILTYIILLVIVSGLLLIIIPQVIYALKDLVSKMDGYISSALSFVNNIFKNSKFFSDDTTIFDFIDVNKILTNLETFLDTSGDILKQVGNFVINYGGNIVGGVTDVFLGLFISIYVLIFKGRIATWFKRIIRAVLSREKYDNFLYRVGHANGKFGNYIIGALTDSLIVAVEGFIIFALFGIPYAPLIAVIVGITNLIPILGPFLGAIPSLFIILIVEPSKAILFLILIIIIQQIDGNIVAPFILGSSLGLSSFGIIIAITVMGGLWGILGMFIGVPLFAFFADLIEEAVNTKLKAIDDPDFPPSEPKPEEKNVSPIITFVKKTSKKIYEYFKNLKKSNLNNKKK